MTPQDTNAPIAADLFGELYLSEASKPEKAHARLYGMVVVSIAALAASWLSEHYGMPIIVLGLLMGLALNFMNSDRRIHPGLDFAGTNCLRLGIVILGTQVTFAQFHALGIVSFVGLLLTMACVVTAGIATARAYSRPVPEGVLAGGATAICGASAALALYGVIGKDRVSQAQFTLTLVAISGASAVAMSFYPLLAGALQLTDQQAGFLIGASIHDVAQAIGGGYAYSQNAGEIATIVKLSRVALLAPLVAVAGLMLGAPGQPRHSLKSAMRLPWFIWAFFGLVCLNSLVTLPQVIGHYGLIVSKTMLLLAVIATAMKSQLRLLMTLGWRSVMPVAASTLVAFLVALSFAVGAL